MTEFEKIYRDYFHDVYLYLRRLSGDENLAEEITSETFFKVMHSIGSFRGNCDIRVWICQIAKNCYYTYLKNSKKVEPVKDAELSFKQIGHIFGKSENWACVTYHRAKAMIKSRLEDKTYEK